MKSILLTVTGPIVAAIASLCLSYLVGQPSGTMFCLIGISMFLAMAIAFLAVHRLRVDPPQFWRMVLASLTFCIVMAYSFSVLWALSEELYIRFFTQPSMDMPGIERYIYPGNSGMGFARGIPGLHGTLVDATIAATTIGLLWTPVALALVVFANKRTIKGQQAGACRLADSAT